MKQALNISIEGAAKKLNDDKIVLTSGLHSTGEMRVAQSLPIKGSWSCFFTLTITEELGVSDIDGVGGDGIKMILKSYDGQELFAVNIDTFKNLENVSGNEVVVYFEGTKVAQASCNNRFNDGNPKKVKVIYDHRLETVVVKVDDTAVVAYAFNDIAFYDLIDDSVYLCFTSFTGDAGGNHEISDISLDY